MRSKDVFNVKALEEETVSFRQMESVIDHEWLTVCAILRYDSNALILAFQPFCNYGSRYAYSGGNAYHRLVDSASHYHTIRNGC